MNVWPMNSGTIVQSRAQVLIGSRLLPRFSTFASRRSLTYGPLRMERPIQFPRYRDCMFYECCEIRPGHFLAFSHPRGSEHLTPGPLISRHNAGQDADGE